MLAFIEERRRRPDEARVETERITVAENGSSPRRRYGELPEAAIARDSAEFARAAEQARALLAAGLAAGRKS
jgi:hypothetical protein